MRLLLQHQLGVARQSAAEVIGQTHRGVEGLNGDGGRAAGASSEARRRGTEHVHPGVTHRHHAGGRAGGERGSGGVGGTGSRERVAPQSSSSAELGDGGEHVGIGREGERELRRRNVDGEPGVDQRAEVLDAGGEHDRQLLGLARPGIDVRRGVDVDGLHVRPRGCRHGEIGRIGERLCEPTGEAASGGERAEWVGAQVAAPLVGAHAVAVPDLDEEIGCRREVRSGLEHDRHQVEVDTVEQRRHVVDTTDHHAVDGAGAADIEAERQRVHPAVEVFEDAVVGLGGNGVLLGLADLPRAVRRAGGGGAPGEIGLTGELLRRLGAISRRVERLDRDAVVGRRDELAVEVGALQHLVDQRSPLLSGRSREVGGERQIRCGRHSRSPTRHGAQVRPEDTGGLTSRQMGLAFRPEDEEGRMDAANLGLLMLRLAVGGTMAAHGYNHIWGGGKIKGTAGWFESLGMKPGKLHAWLASITELGAGALLALGLLTPLAGAGCAAVMLVAWLTNHRTNGFFIFRPGEGYEYVMNLFVASLALAFIGAGEWSLDHAFDIAADLDGWTAVIIGLVGGIGGALGLLAVFWRPVKKDPAAS